MSLLRSELLTGACHGYCLHSNEQADKSDRKFDPAPYRASGRRQWCAAHLAVPGIWSAVYRACARQQAMRVRSKGANSEPHGTTRAVRGASAAARVPRSALRDVGHRLIGDGDESVSRPVGRLRGAGPRAAGSDAQRPRLVFLVCEPPTHHGRYDFPKSDLSSRVRDMGFDLAFKGGLVRSPPPEAVS